MSIVTSPARGANHPRRWLTPLNLLLLAVPVAVVLKLVGVGGVWMFVAAGAGIVPLAGLIGRATEALASRVGPDLYPVVKATSPARSSATSCSSWARRSWPAACDTG